MPDIHTLPCVFRSGEEHLRGTSVTARKYIRRVFALSQHPFSGSYTDTGAAGIVAIDHRFQDNAVSQCIALTKKLSPKTPLVSPAIVAETQLYFPTRDCFSSRAERLSALLIKYAPFSVARNCGVATGYIWPRVSEAPVAPVYTCGEIIYDRSHPISRFSFRSSFLPERRIKTWETDRLLFTILCRPHFIHLPRSIRSQYCTRRA